MSGLQKTSPGYHRIPGFARVPRAPTPEERQQQGLEIVHTRQEPVLLIGHGSSGTSICAGLIRKYCAVAFGNESQFMLRLAKLSKDWGDLSNPAILKAAVRRMLAERYFQRAAEIYDFHPTLEQITGRVRQPTMAGVYHALFELMADHQHTTRWGDKSPEYMDRLPELGALFPNAQYILVVRDGRDTALSVIPRYFGPNNLITAAEEWGETARHGREFLETIPADRKLVIRYEDLMTDPVARLREVMGFLQAQPRDPQMLDRAAAQIRSELKAENFDKWKKKMSPRDRETFEAIAGPELKYYGYATEYETPRPVTAG
ncbi:MAG: sulfotransferase family protein, partial [Planctomycetaceae bacterium]